jgi:protein TonB
VTFHLAEDKKNHARALLISLVAHVLVFFIFLSMTNQVIQTNKPIVIDFSVEESVGGGKRSLGYKTAVQEIKRGGTVHKREIKGNRTEIAKKEMVVEEPKEKSVSQSDTLIERSANVETDEPVLIPVAENTQSANEEDIISMSASSEASSGSTGGLYKGEGSLRGMGRGIIGQSGDGSGGVGHGGKARYLKENFSYIRDLIQRRVVYPVIARRMGWQGRVKVSFIIFADGFAKDVNIIQTSGIEILDRSAIKAVKEASPFPKPPCEAQIIIPLVYRLN